MQEIIAIGSFIAGSVFGAWLTSRFGNKVVNMFKRNKNYGVANIDIDTPTQRKKFKLPKLRRRKRERNK